MIVDHEEDFAFVGATVLDQSEDGISDAGCIKIISREEVWRIKKDESARVVLVFIEL